MAMTSCSEICRASANAATPLAFEQPFRAHFGDWEEPWRFASPAETEDSLRRAVAESAQQVYPADSACRAGDQMCFDSIQFRLIGVITQPLIEWVNRPTFQQAIEIGRSVGR